MKRLIISLFLIFAAVTATAQQVDHSLFTAVLQDYVEAGQVKYRLLKEDPRLDRYIESLEAIDPEELTSDREKLAFWINAYNAYTLKAIKDNYPVESINDLHSGGLIFGSLFKTTIWDKKFIVINRKKYTLNIIEHKIIRPEFGDPRIHFALVCAAKSCPPLRAEAYTADRLDAQLDDQARIFLNNNAKNGFNLASRKAEISSIMSWYKGDFGRNNTELLKALAPYLPAEVAASIESEARNWDVSFKSYDWSLNEIN